jgi:hypothetical protein
MANEREIQPIQGLKPLQFTLRTMFVAVSALGGLFALMGVIGPIASAALLLVVAVVGLHVVGTALGTSLRDQAPTRSADQATSTTPIADGAIAVRASLPLHRLHQRTSLSWLIGAASIAGALVGGWIGNMALAEWADVSLRGIILGTASSGILGGLAGFLGGSFLQMSLAAWWQASTEEITAPRTS